MAPAPTMVTTASQVWGSSSFLGTDSEQPTSRPLNLHPFMGPGRHQAGPTPHPGGAVTTVHAHPPPLLTESEEVVLLLSQAMGLSGSQPNSNQSHCSSATWPCSAFPLPLHSLVGAYLLCQRLCWDPAAARQGVAECFTALL